MIQIGNNKPSIVSKKTIPLRVRLITEIEIPFNDQRQIFSGSMIKMITILKHNGETFNHGIAPMSFMWNCTHSHILSITIPGSNEDDSLTLPAFHSSPKAVHHYQHRNKQTFYTQFNSSSVYGIASKPGEASVAVRMAYEYPEEYSQEQNWFDTLANVRVTQKLSIDVPEYIQTGDQETHLYLLPPNAVNKIKTNK